MNSTVYYLAYGSNLHPKRLQARCPSATWLQSVHLQGYQFTFNCKGNDYSGKGNLVKTGDPKHRAVAAVYAMDNNEKPTLDAIEGAPYTLHYIDVELEIGKQSCFIYLAKDDYIDDSLLPYQWYKDLVYWGAHFNQADEKLIEQIDAVAAKHDEDTDRQNLNSLLVEEIIESLSL